MLKCIESSGKTVDEAIFKGLLDIGLSIDEVEIEVLQHESKGILGIGRKDAKVKLTQKPEDEVIVPDFAELSRNRGHQRESGRDDKYGRNERTSQREQRPRPPQRSEKPVQVEKPQRSETPVQGERQQRNERSVQGERQQRNEKPVQGEKQQRNEKPVQGERQQRNEKPVQGEKQQRNEKPVQGEKQQRNEKPVQGEKQQRNEKPQNADKRVNNGNQKPRNERTPAKAEKPRREVFPEDNDPSLSDAGDESITFTVRARPERQERKYNLDAYKPHNPTAEDLAELRAQMAPLNDGYVDESLLVVKEARAFEPDDASEISGHMTKAKHVSSTEDDVEQPLIEATLEATENEPGAVFLRDLLEIMGIEVAVRTAATDENVTIQIDSESMALIIGHRGETLDALQYITSLVVNKDRKTAGYRRVSLDTEGYRVKREATLSRLARRMAQQVKQTGKSRIMEPMNPYERRILHATLQNNPYVTTHSEGDEPNRRVVISPRTRKRNNYNRTRGRKPLTDKTTVNKTSEATEVV